MASHKLDNHCESKHPLKKIIFSHMKSCSLSPDTGSRNRLEMSIPVPMSELTSNSLLPHKNNPETKALFRIGNLS